MNIFILDKDPRIAAQMLCDAHSYCMLKESGQILSTVMHKTGGKGPLKINHPNHPCTIWAGATRENYLWLWNHMDEMSQEYSRRYGKIHAYDVYLGLFLDYAKNIPEGELTPFAQAVGEQYKQNDAVAAYRAFYLGDKSYFAKWKHGNEPDWWLQAKLLSVS